MSSIFQIQPTTPEGAKTISYSQFSLYSECPHKWKLMYIDKQKPTDQSIHLIFGTAMHEVIQEYLTIVFEKSAKEGDKLDINKLLYDKLIEQYKMAMEKTSEPFTNRLQMDEFYKDGISILEFLRKRRAEYFPTKHHKLLGVEIPLLSQVDDYNVYLKGFIDLVILDSRDNTIIVYDLKTSTRGWGDKDKKNEIKKSQLIIYKEYLSKQYDIPVDDIEVIFLILKRKLWEESDFTQKRIQIFKPPSGKVTRKKVNTKLLEFVEKAFTKDGEYRTDVEHYAVAGDSDKNCKWCPFKDKHDLCPPANRCYY